MRKNGFTLAEVLITMGIIGIIAAITMPTVIMNTKYKQLGVKLSKFYSSLYNVTKEYTAYNLEFGSTDDLLTHLTKSFDFKSIESANGGQSESLGTFAWGYDYPPTKATFDGENRGVLSDNTGIAVQMPYNGVDYSVPANYQNTRKFGTPFARVYFDPNIKGLPSSSQHIFQFLVTTKGDVIPNDGCVQTIFRNNWIVNSDFYANDGVCNIIPDPYANTNTDTSTNTSTDTDTDNNNYENNYS